MNIDPSKWSVYSLLCMISTKRIKKKWITHTQIKLNLKYIFTNDGKKKKIVLCFDRFASCCLFCSISIARSCAAFSFSNERRRKSTVYSFTINITTMDDTFWYVTRTIFTLHRIASIRKTMMMMADQVNEKFTHIHTTHNDARDMHHLLFCANFSPYFLTSSGMHVPLTFDGIGRVRVSVYVCAPSHIFIGKIYRAVNQSSFNGALSFPFGFTFHGK